jgi:superoxide reductase
MEELKDLLQSADWVKEKHVPVIDAPQKAKKSEPIEIKLCVGRQIPHPNTTEHHIRWIEAYFLPEEEKFPYQLARIEFNAHGESTQGPNTSTVFTGAEAVITFKTDKPGIILASSYCNIHGIWQSSKKLELE